MDGFERADETGAHPAPVLPPFPRMPLWQLYLFVVATIGVYDLVWFYRAGRVSRARTGKGPAPFFWSLAPILGIVGAVALHRLHARARAALRELGVPAPGAGPFAGGLFFLLSFGLTRLQAGMLLPLVLLLPIPLVWVQHDFNRTAGAAGVPIARRSLGPTLARVVAVTLGLALTATYFWRTDRPALVAWLSERVANRSVLTSERGAYSLTVDGAAWSRVPSGTIARDDSDLELHVRGGHAWIVVHVIEGSARSLDDVVDTRRGVAYTVMRSAKRSEQRRFLDSGHFDPMSLVSYEGRSLTTRVSFEIATAMIDDHIVEVVGFADDPKWRDDVEQTVKSLESHRATP